MPGCLKGLHLGSVEVYQKYFNLYCSFNVLHYCEQIVCADSSLLDYRTVLFKYGKCGVIEMLKYTTLRKSDNIERIPRNEMTVYMSNVEAVGARKRECERKKKTRLKGLEHARKEYRDRNIQKFLYHDYPLERVLKNKCQI